MSMQATEPKKKQSLLSNVMGGSKTIWIIAMAAALVAVAGALFILGQAAATSTYYVLKRDVPARTQITPDMLVPKEAKTGDSPANAFDLVYVRDNPVFSLVALNDGDVVSRSNAGPLTRISADLPDNFVAASFSIAPENAVAGKVRKGDFIDLIASQDAGDAGKTAKVVLQHVLVLDVTVAPASIAQEATDGQEGENLTPGPESEAVRSGIPSVYTVGVSPEDATKLALVRPLDLFVTLSANAPEQTMDVQTQLGNVFTDPANDSSAGTFGSVFLKRYDHAFDAGNTFVDASGAVWKVNSKKVWQSGESVLGAGDTPPGYLTVPNGTEFTDKDNTYWVVKGGKWTTPDGSKGALQEGDNPDGFNPHAQFKQKADTDSAGSSGN